MSPKAFSKVASFSLTVDIIPCCSNGYMRLHYILEQYDLKFVIAYDH